MDKWITAAALALSACAASAWAQAPAKPIPTADFAALPLVHHPILSPDGRRIAARATIDGKTQLLVMDADRPDAQPNAYPLGDAEVAALQWAGNGRLLLTALLTQDFHRVEVPVLRLFVIDVQSGAIRPADSRSRGIYAGDVLYADPTGSWALVAGQQGMASYPSVNRVDLATGEATEVERSRENVWDWYADDKGVVRAGIAYEGRRWTIWYRDAPGERLEAIRGKLAKEDGSAVDRIIFGRNQESWIVTNERTGRFALYKYDVKSGSVGQALFEHPEVDLENVTYDPITGKIIRVNFQDDRARTLWLDPESKTLQAKLDKALPDAVNVVTDSSTDEKRHLVWSGSASDPGTYFLLDRVTSKMHPVIAPYERIDPTQLSEVKAVKYASRDGLSIPAYLTLPRGRQPTRLPLIVLPHGGPFERDEWVYDPFVQFLANRGYAVLQPQFRGSTGYGKTFVEKGYGEFGRKMQDDLDDGVDWLAKSGQIDPKRVCIVGMSYGGYAAMWGAIRNPERYRCAASWAGVSDLPGLLRTNRKLFSATRYYREWRSKVAGQSNANLSAVSPVLFADKLKVPLLIGHGEKDQTVPVSQGLAMAKAADKAGAKVISVFYKESGHSFGSDKDLEDWLRRLEHFLASNNPA